MKTKLLLILTSCLLMTGCFTWTQTNTDGTPRHWACGPVAIHADGDANFQWQVLQAMIIVQQHTGQQFVTTGTGITMHHFWPAGEIDAAGFSDNAFIGNPGIYWKAQSWTNPAYSLPNTNLDMLVTMLGVHVTAPPTDEEWTALRSITC